MKDTVVESFSHPHEGKILNDPVHGHFKLPSYCISIIDTPQFQRLRDLKQLGVTYYVFPGACHNRFEHCLGVSKLAHKAIRKFKDTQPDLGLTDRDIRNVTVAGLIHDLGHGPFSHSFQKWTDLHKPHLKFIHEVWSQKLFRKLLDEYAIDGYEEDDIKFIEELIMGNCSKKFEEKAWMYEIVANKRNSVDVDKFDYLARDSRACGFPTSYFGQRLIINSRVIGNEICYNAKESWTLYSLFQTRYNMFKQVYSHKTGNAIECMIADALNLADPVLKISEDVTDLDRYTYLTDSFLKSIEASTDQSLKEARDLILRVRRRDLYVMADERIISGENIVHWKMPTPADIITCQSHDQSFSLNENDIIIDSHHNNYALNDQDPIKNIHWFNKWDDQTSFSIPSEDISLLTPKKFSEKYVRIFAKDEKKRKAVQIAWKNYLSRNYGASPSPQHQLPEKNSLNYNREEVKKRISFNGSSS